MQSPDVVSMAQALRRAYLDVYLDNDPRATKAHWDDLAMQSKRMYEQVAERLLQLGAKAPPPDAPPPPHMKAPRPRKSASIKTGEGFLYPDQ